MLTGACAVNQLFDHTGDEITLGDVERITICDEARRAIPGFLEGRQEPEPGASENQALHHKPPELRLQNMGATRTQD